MSAPHEYEDLLETSSAAADEAAETSRPPGLSHLNNLKKTDKEHSVEASSSRACGETQRKQRDVVGFSAAAEPEDDASETIGLGSTIGLGGAGLGATPQGGSDWEGLGSTPGLGTAATPDPGSTPVVGGAVFRKASDDTVKASFLAIVGSPMWHEHIQSRLHRMHQDSSPTLPDGIALEQSSQHSNLLLII